MLKRYLFERQHQLNVERAAFLIGTGTLIGAGALIVILVAACY
jgi:ABC-type lipoprotein release transport system permease subunit